MTASQQEQDPGASVVRPGAPSQSSATTNPAASGGTPITPTPSPGGSSGYPAGSSSSSSAYPSGSSAADRAKADAARAGEEAKAAAHELGASAGRQAEGLKGQAEKAVEAAKERARSVAGEQKNLAAERVAGFADALRHASSDLDEKGQSLVSGIVRQAADGLEDFSGAMRRNDLDDVVGSIENFARRQPALFIGSAVLAGFGIARFMKASSERRRGRPSDYQSTRFEQGGARYGAGPGTTYEGGV